MNKKQITALVLIGLAAIIFILNSRGSADVNIIFTEVKALRSLVFFGFTALGVIIGVLVK